MRLAQPVPEAETSGLAYKGDFRPLKAWSHANVNRSRSSDSFRMVRHGQRADRASVEHWRTSRQWHPAAGRVHLTPLTSLWQNQRSFILAAEGAEPLRWDGIRVKRLIEAGETIL